MKKWYRLGLFNLFALVFLGLLLGYKTVFSLPFIDYKNALHSHSHFAFNGWISFLLQMLILTDHDGLLVVWKIRQGVRFDISNKRIANFVLHAFEKHLERHFLEEEELLFTKLSVEDELLAKARS